MSEGTTRAEAAAHILARETGRRMRAVQARIDEVEEQRKIALDAIASRLVSHDGSDERQDGLIDGLRADLGSVQQVASAIDQAHGETRELTAAQAQELVRIAQRLTANEATDARQDAVITEVVDRVDVLEATAPVPGPKGEKGDRGPSGPRGGMGPPGVPGAVGSGTGGGTGGGTINSVSVSSGLSITGTSDLTITNAGVRSLAGSGLTVSDSTGAVTITAASVTGGTGITVAGSGTTALTVSATGVNSVSAGTGISVSGTTALTVSATGVQSLTAGNGISVSGTTTPTVSASLAAGTGIGISGTTTLSVSNTGVTSIVAGTNVSVSGATGAVTVNAPAYGTTITASTIGGTAAAGTSTTIAREDHKHAFPSGAAPSALTVSSTQATGTSASPALADHVHAMPGSATAGASAVGDTATTGTATTVALSDHRHSREAFGTPVVVNGQTTALATGSLTTLARADHVHTMSNVPVLLASTTLSSAAASITFSSIPQGYTHLYIVAHCRSLATGGAIEEMMLRLNGDTGSNYYKDSTAGTFWSFIGNTASAFSTLTFAAVTMTISNYSNTIGAYRKVMTGLGVMANSTTAHNSGATFPYGLWLTTSAITSLSVTPSTASNLATGSAVALYGIP